MKPAKPGAETADSDTDQVARSASAKSYIRHAALTLGVGGMEMWKIIWVNAFGLVLAACGGGIGSYEEGMDAQAQVMEDMVSVLRNVDDEASARKAAGKIEDLGNRLAEISAQITELPRPNAKEMQSIAKQQMAKRQSAQQEAAEQMMKMAEYPVLMEAWMRAMENMR